VGLTGELPVRSHALACGLLAVALLAGAAPGGSGNTERGAMDFAVAPTAGIDFGPGSAAFATGLERFTISFPCRRTGPATGPGDPLLQIGSAVSAVLVTEGEFTERVRVIVDGDDGTATARASLPLEEDLWVVVTAVYDGAPGATLRIYLDGVLLASKPAAGLLAPPSGPLAIGTASGGPAPAAVRLGSVSIWGDALSDDDVAELAIGRDPASVRSEVLLRHVPLVDNGDGTVTDTVTAAIGVITDAAAVDDDYPQNAHAGQSRELPATLPRLHANDPEAWAARFDAAQTSTVRIALFGDSQETRPAGAGSVVIGRLAYRLHELVDNTPETPFLSAGISSPWSWLASVGSQRQGTTAPDTGGADPASVETRTWSRQGTGSQPYPFLAKLVPGAENEVPAVEAPLRAYFDTSANVVADVYVRPREGSGGVRVREAPDETAPLGGYFETVVATHTFPADLPDVNGNVLDSGDLPETLRRFTTPPFTIDPGGPPYPQAYIDALEEDGSTIDLVGMRFRNADDPAGFVLDPLAAGGYRTSTHVTHHAAAGPFLRSQAYSLAVIMTGTNDMPNGQARFTADLRALIQLIRDGMDDPGFPIVLVSEAGRNALLEEPGGAVDFAHQNAYPLRRYELALEDDNLLFLNMRRILEEDLQWIPRRTLDEPITSSVNLYLSDRVHYSERGAVAYADAFVNELIPNDWVPFCPADFTGPVPGDRDGNVDALDFLLMISQWGDPCAGVCVTDVAGPGDAPDGAVDTLDILVLIAEWGSDCLQDCRMDVTGPLGVPDGAVDSLDLLRLLEEWGNPCNARCESDIAGPAGPFPDGVVDALDLLKLLAQWGSPAECSAE
jgi:hypothetical protein